MKTKVHSNSIDAYEGHIKGMKDKTQNEVILHWFPRIQPCNCRTMTIATGFELSSVRRAMHDLEEEKKIEVAYIGKCSVKNTTVKFFRLKKTVVAPLKRKPISVGNNQISLFQNINK